jgi:hypothetical protein
VQHDLDPRRGILPDPQAVEARGNDLGVVEDQHVPGPEQVRQVADDAILQRLAGSNHEHARTIARFRRAERDPVVRQLEVEEVDAHGLLPIPGSASLKPHRARRSRHGL